MDEALSPPGGNSTVRRARGGRNESSPPVGNGSRLVPLREGRNDYHVFSASRTRAGLPTMTQLGRDIHRHLRRPVASHGATDHVPLSHGIIPGVITGLAPRSSRLDAPVRCDDGSAVVPAAPPPHCDQPQP